MEMAKMSAVLFLCLMIGLSLAQVDEDESKYPFFRYNVNNKTCVVMNVTMNLFVGYVDVKSINKTISLPVDNPSIDNDASYCNKTIATNISETLLTLSWAYNSSEYTIKFSFIANYTSDKYWKLDSTLVTIPVDGNDAFDPTPEEMPEEISANFTNAASINQFPLLSVYICNSESNITQPSENGTSMFNITLNLSNFKFQAFSFDNSTDGSFEKENVNRCQADLQDSKIVPIAVGAALAGLVIIVLIAYIIGRIRNRKQQGTYEALS